MADPSYNYHFNIAYEAAFNALLNAQSFESLISTTPASIAQLAHDYATAYVDRLLKD